MARKGKGPGGKKRPPDSTTTIAKAEVSMPLDVESAAQIKAAMDKERAALDRLRLDLDGHRAAHLAELQAMEEREQRVEERRRKVNDDERALTTDRRDLDKLKSALADRDRTLTSREAEADAGFATRNDEAIESLNNRLRTVRSAIDQAEKALAERRIAAHKKLETELSTERESRTNTMTTETATRRGALDDELNTRRADVEAALAEAQTLQTEQEKAWRAKKGTEAKALTTERSRQSAEAVGLHAREQELSLQRKLHEADLDALEATIAARAKLDVETLTSKLKQKDDHLDSLRTDHNRMQQRIDRLRAAAQQFGDKSPGDVLQELRDLHAQVDTLTDELTQRPSTAALQQLAELGAERDGWEQTRSELQRQVASLKGERSTWLLEQAELEHQRDLAEAAHRIRDALKAETDRLDAEVQRLRGLYDTPKEKEARIGVIEDPWFKDLEVTDDPIEELQWLTDIHQQCIEVGMSFPPRLLEAFHTSLKCAEWSALTVLAGVSGTGKSEMPRLYARFGGLAYLPLAVEPNWDSPQSLLGFFNSIDNRFNAKPLLRALVQSQMSPHDNTAGLSDRVLLVLLDEMNLAHVELYFSDLLSKLEDRRGQQDGETKVDVDLGAGLEPYALPLGRNVLWTGTMNEDATTKSLSDKVLDRSNLLVFPRPKLFKRRGRVELPAPAPLLARSTWDSWINDATELTEAEVAPFKVWLEEVNSRLEFVGRALGHRIWQSVEAYMMAHPKVIAARAAEDNDAFVRCLRSAFEDAVVHKVMPKLRGIETSGKSSRECLEPIQQLLSDEAVGLHLTDDFQHARNVGHGAFIWSSARYLEEDAP